MIRPCKFPLPIAALALLTACAVPPPAPAPAPVALAPSLSAADLHKAEQHAYWSGYAAGRRYQKQQDALATPNAPSPAPVADTAPPTEPAPAADVPPPPVPPPVDGYAAQGMAKPAN